jgi:hypothetical protein
VELAKNAAALLDPSGGDAFYFLDEFGYRDGSREGGQQMHMVGNAADLDGQATEGFGATAEIGMHFGPECVVVEGGLAAFRREHGMDDDAGKRLGHGVNLGRGGDGRNPFGVV